MEEIRSITNRCTHLPEQNDDGTIIIRQKIGRFKESEYLCGRNEKVTESFSMKTRYKVIIGICVACLAVAAGILSACHGRLKMDILTEAEAFLPAEPDSADARLRQMDMKRSGKEEVALYSLLRTVTDAIKGDSVPDEEFVNAAYSFYAQESHNGSASTAPVLKRFAQSALYMGDWYARLDSVKAAEDCYRQAISASERCEDWHTCYVSLQRLAEQVKWGNEEEALRLIERAIAIYDNCNDNIQNKLSLHDCAANYKLEMAYFTGSSYQDAIDEANKEYELAKSQHLPEYENQALRTLAHIYRINDDHIRALSYAKKIKIQDSNHAMLWMSELASCYLACDSLDQARGLYHLLVQSSDKKDKYLAICGLTEVAIQLGDRDSAVFYMDSAFRCLEAMYMDALQAKNDYYQETLKQEREKDRRMLELIVSAIAIVALIIISIFFNKKERLQKRVLELEYNKLEDSYYATLKQLEETQNDVAILQQETIKDNAIIKLLKEKEELITQLESTVRSLQEQIGLSQDIVQSRKVEESEIIQHFHLIVQHHCVSKNGTAQREKPRAATTEEWAKLVEAVQQYHPAFYLFIVNRKLSALKFKVSILSFLGFDNHEITILTNANKGSIPNARTSLAKELFGLSSAHELDDHLRQIEPHS